VPDIALRSDADTVVGIDESNVFHGIIVALQVEGVRVRGDVRDLLLRVPDSQSANGTGMAHLEKGEPFLLAAPAGSQYDRAFERLTPNRGFHDALKCDPGGNVQAAFD